MKINNEKLRELSAMGDHELWATIRGIAAAHGFKLPEKTPSAEEMAKLRHAITGGAKINLSDAMRIINNYKREKK